MAEDLTPDLAGNDYGPSPRAVGTDLSHQAHATFTNMASDCPGRCREGGRRCCDAARAPATAYGNVSAMGSKGVATDAEWRAVVDDANAKDAGMKKECDSGSSAGRYMDSCVDRSRLCQPPR